MTASLSSPICRRPFVRFTLLVVLGGALSLSAAKPAAADEPVLPELTEGDRVLFVGNTLIERKQLYDFVEQAMTTRFGGVTFRNLGWSGDTVRGEARAYFGTPEDGFQHLKEHVHELEPDVIFAGYGLNESYQGEQGLEPFTQALDRLTQMLEETEATLIFLSPLPHEQATSPVPDVSPQNANLVLYSDTIRDYVEGRGHGYVDLITLRQELEVEPDQPLTDNGLHLTAFGYHHLAGMLETGLGWQPRQWQVHIEAGQPRQVDGARVRNIRSQDGGLRFDVTDDLLPLDMPEGVEATHSNYLPPRVLRVAGLDAGTYTLTVDGHQVATADAEEWAAGVVLAAGPAFDQAAELREQIRIKNEFYFHKFRPQNETYIRGFRDHEQGHLTSELPAFDPHIEQQEQKIDELRRPRTHVYELNPAD